MERRDFFEKTGCSVLGLMLAHFGLKMPLNAGEEMNREKMVMKMLMEKMGKTKEEAQKMIEDFKKKLPMIQKMCICKGCPSYVKDESVVGFCHPLLGKIKVIKKKKGCICGKCPVYKKMELTKGYYCTRGSEMEQKMMK